MDKEIKKYLAAVRRRLNLPGKIKDRCLSDLETSVNARLEQGQTWEQIRDSLGGPKVTAAELNEQMKDYAYRKSPWRFIFLVLAALSGAWLAFYAGMQLVLQFVANEAASVGIIGGADGPTAIFITTGTVMDWDVVIMGAILLIGILGFLRLRHCRPKE